MFFKTLTAAAALGLMAAPAMAQTPEAQLTTPPPADQAQPAPQTQAAPQGEAAAPTPEQQQQQQAVIQMAQTYLAMTGIDAYAERCQPLPAGEATLLDAQITALGGQFEQAGADLSQQREQVLADANSAECGTGQMQTAYDALSQQLANPIDQLVLSFDQVETSCRNNLLETDDAQFSALVEERKARHGGEVPEQIQSGVPQTVEAINGACADANEQEIAAMKQGAEIRALRAALAE